MGMLSTADNEDSGAIEAVFFKGFITAKGRMTIKVFHLCKDKVSVSIVMLICYKVYIRKCKFIFSMKSMTYGSGLCSCCSSKQLNMKQGVQNHCPVQNSQFVKSLQYHDQREWQGIQGHITRC